MSGGIKVRNDVVVGSWKRTKDVVIPAGATKIAAGVFRKSQMSTITIPPGLREVGELAFEECGYLREVIFPSGL